MIRPLFKAHEPFMEVTSGFGFLGVVMYDDSNDLLQCHICGKWFSMLLRHVGKTHKIEAQDYRDRFSLPISGGLVSKKFSETMSRNALRPDRLAALGKVRPSWDSSDRCVARRKSRIKIRSKIGLNRLARKNKFGLCPKQMLARYEVVKLTVGGEPSSDDIRAHDFKLWAAIKKHHGWNNWKRENGLAIREQGASREFGDLEIIAKMRKWAKVHGRRPNTLDMRRYRGELPGYCQVVTEFGSVLNAYAAAGLK